MRRRAKAGMRSNPRAKDPLFTNLLDHPGHLIRRVHQISVSAFLETCDELDLTPTQYAALAGVANRPGIDQAALAGLIAIDRSTTGVVVARLVQRKLMQRRHNSKDRRFMSLELTTAGMEVYRAMAGRAAAAHDRMFRPLSNAERKVFVHLITKMVQLNNEISRAPLQLRDDEREGDAPPKLSA